MFPAIQIVVQTVSRTTVFNPIQDGPFWHYSGMQDKKAPPS